MSVQAGRVGTRPAVGARRGGGLAAGIATQALWSLAVAVPLLVPQASGLAQTTGRYLVLGAFSALLLAVRRPPRIGASGWGVAVALGLCGNVGQFFLFLIGMRLAGAATAVIVVGTLPVCVAVAANARRRETAWRGLALPVALTAGGVGVVNADRLGSLGGPGAAYWLGIVSLAGAVALWTAYALGNAEWLARRPDLSGADWSSYVGAATLPLALAALPFLAPEWNAPGFDRAGFVAGALALGLVVSWCATALWNRASVLLPTTLAGQVIALEPCFSLAVVHLLQRQAPPAWEVVGFLLALGGVWLTVRATAPRA